MDAHRKLIVLGVNKLLERNLISLCINKNEKDGHIITDIAGETSVVIWSEIGNQELRISVWWKYNASAHLQINLAGNARETFISNRPVVRKLHYPKFVGATVSGWLERKTGKHLQGTGRGGLYNIYTRTGEKAALECLADPTSNGFDAEGKFFR